MGKFRTLITGASSGLGAELARQSAGLGHDLALCARRTDRLEALAEEIEAANPDVTVRVYALDVTDDEAVREVFNRANTDFDGLDRIVVNAGMGKGRPIGSGSPEANRQTAVTNVLGVLSQTEAAMEMFRAANSGHLVLVSSISAIRGNRKAVTTYGATKAFVANLGEGLQVDLMSAGVPIDVTVLLPGYIESELTMAKEGKRPPLMVDTTTGVRSMLAAMEARKRKALVPAKPWLFLGTLLRFAPLRLVSKMT